MAVTTEPPWLHKSAGVAARNGTTSHTITFNTNGDAPFTPGTGTELVLVVFGAVTHSASGWTEREQPVSSGELSLFTITSAPTASVTVTHNGSNYPIEWCVYEFPAGTTFTASANSTTSAETFPTLSGLPGTEQVVIAARGRTATSASETGATAAWTAPFVEDSDLYTGFSATDGGHMTTGHAINITATSVTPVATTTYGGSWSTPDRERIVAAFNVTASGTTPFTKDVVLQSRVLAAVTKDTVVTSRVLAALTKDTVVTSRVLNAVTVDTVTVSRVLNAVTKDTVATSRVLATVTVDTVTQSRVLAALTKDTVVTSRVLAALTKDTVVTSRVLNAVTVDTVTVSRVLNAVTVDTVTQSRVLAALTKDYDLASRVLNAVTKDVELWSAIASPTGIDKTYDLVSRILNDVTVDTDLQARVRNAVTVDTDFAARVLNEVTRDYELVSSIRAAVTNDTAVAWSIRNTVAGDTDLRWSIRNTVSADFVLTWSAGGAIYRDIDLRWQIQGTATAVFCDVDLRWSIVDDLPAVDRLFPDVQRLLVEHLAVWVGADRVDIETPDDLQTQLPFIRVQRVGGGRDRVSDYPTVEIQVYASTYAQVQPLAERISEWLCGPPSPIAQIDRALCTSAATEIPYGDVRIRRMVATYQLTTRRVRVPAS